LADSDAPDEQTKLATFKIDFHKITAELVKQSLSAPFDYTSRRANTIMLHRYSQDIPDTSALVLDTLHQPLFANNRKTAGLYNSINDDYFMVQNNAEVGISSMHVSYADGSATAPRFEPVTVTGTDKCELHRPRSSEKDASQEQVWFDDLAFVLWCPDKVPIVKHNDVVLYENEKLPKRSGKIVKSFTNFEQSEFLLMFEDLSMRLI